MIVYLGENGKQEQSAKRLKPMQQRLGEVSAQNITIFLALLFCHSETYVQVVERARKREEARRKAGRVRMRLFDRPTFHCMILGCQAIEHKTRAERRRKGTRSPSADNSAKSRRRK